MRTAKATASKVNAQDATRLSELQRRALQCLEGARAEGTTQSAYAKARGWDLRGIYDALARLRRTGRAPAAAAVRSTKADRASNAHRVSLRFARITAADASRSTLPASPSQPLHLRLRWVLRTGRPVEIDVEPTDRLGEVLQILERVDT